MPRGVYKRKYKISHSSEAREKIRAARTGSKLPEQTKRKIGLAPHVKGEKHGMAVLTEEQVLEIRKLFTTGSTQKALAQKFNVAKGTIWNIVRHRTWTHI